MHITQQIQRWGNSPALRLPKKVVDAAKLTLGQSVEIDLRGTSIVLTPVERSPERLPSLDELLSGVTPAKVGGEVNWGQDRGRERVDD